METNKTPPDEMPIAKSNGLKTESLNYVGLAYAERDGKDGYKYLHKWPLGFEFLVFSTHEEANALRDTLK